MAEQEDYIYLSNETWKRPQFEQRVKQVTIWSDLENGQWKQNRKKKINRPLSKIATQYLECYYVKTWREHWKILLQKIRTAADSIKTRKSPQLGSGFPLLNLVQSTDFISEISQNAHLGVFYGHEGVTCALPISWQASGYASYNRAQSDTHPPNIHIH